MPVYGAGYLHEDYGSSLYSMFAAMSDDMLEKYKKYYDPAAYLGDNITPTFWLQGVNDPAFSPVQKQKAVDLIKKVEVQYGYWESMTHGQEFGSEPKELLAFANSIVNKTNEIIMLEEEKRNETSITLKSKNDIDIKKSYLFWTDALDYDMHQAQWYRNDVTVEDGCIIAQIPEGASYAFIKVIDIYDNVVSSKFYGEY